MSYVCDTDLRSLSLASQPTPRLTAATPTAAMAALLVVIPVPSAAVLSPVMMTATAAAPVIIKSAVAADEPTDAPHVIVTQFVKKYMHILLIVYFVFRSIFCFNHFQASTTCFHVVLTTETKFYSTVIYRQMWKY